MLPLWNHFLSVSVWFPRKQTLRFWDFIYRRLTGECFLHMWRQIKQDWAERKVEPNTIAPEAPGDSTGRELQSWKGIQILPHTRTKMAGLRIPCIDHSLNVGCCQGGDDFPWGALFIWVQILKRDSAESPLQPTLIDVVERVCHSWRGDISCTIQHPLYPPINSLHSTLALKPASVETQPRCKATISLLPCGWWGVGVVLVRLYSESRLLGSQIKGQRSLFDLSLWADRPWAHHCWDPQITSRLKELWSYGVLVITPLHFLLDVGWGVPYFLISNLNF